MNSSERPDATAFEKEMRAEFLKKENLAKLFHLAMPHLDPDAPTLVYILTQADRIGHFTLEPQILRTLYGERYRRIVVITGPMIRPGTNPWVRSCFGDELVWVETDDDVILAMGFIDGGMAEFGNIHLLLQSPRLLIVEFWRQVATGVRPTALALPGDLREHAHGALRGIGIDPEAPFVFFHMRTLKYRPGLTHHGHRTADIASYEPSIRHLLGAGYQVIRLGEPGLEPDGWPTDGYTSLTDALPQDRSVDLAVLASAAFGIAQNSGPIWVAAAFGVPTLRTNAPFEHLNLPYNRDLTLFKRYRDHGSDRFLSYPEILDRRLPSVFRDADFEERRIDVIDNDAEQIDAATTEYLALLTGSQTPDISRQDRFRALGLAYEAEIKQDPWFQSEYIDFYGYAHSTAPIARASLTDEPDFLA